jgi:RNA polymerase sigma factor (sigma-70 family)
MQPQGPFGDQVIASEMELVGAAKAGDLDSFGKLCERYYAAMAAVAYSALADHQLAEDAVQEAFARALVNLRKLKTPAKFAPWLAQICRNVAIDMGRARRRTPTIEDPPAVQDEPQRDSPVEVVRRAINDLPKPMREVLILRYYDDRSYEQISAVLGLSKGAINGLVTRAKRKLAKSLRRRGALEDMP